MANKFIQLLALFNEIVKTLKQMKDKDHSRALFEHISEQEILDGNDIWQINRKTTYLNCMPHLAKHYTSYLVLKKIRRKFLDNNSDRYIIIETLIETIYDVELIPLKDQWSRRLRHISDPDTYNSEGEIIDHAAYWACVFNNNR